MNPIKAGILCLTLSAATVALAQPGPDEVTASLRQSLEEQFRSSTGLGFSRFRCDIPATEKPPRELTCEAVDEEGDHFSYRLVSKEDDQTPKVTTSQPVSQLNPSGLAVLSAPCDEFLGAFGRSDWPAAYASLSPELQDAAPLDRLEAFLEPIRQALGQVRSAEAETYSGPSPGVHLLEYRLATEGGEAVARFRLRFGDDEQARIMAFLVTSAPGSALQATLLADSGRQTLTPLLGRPVVRIDAPLSKLQVIGDAVEGVAILDDGSDIMIRAEQHDTAHDLNGNDYRFQVLEAAWLLREHLVSEGEAPETIDCPARTAPDGGELGCAVVLEDGSRKTLTLARRGGDHRLVR